MISGVYKIESQCGKIYIGSSKDIVKRWSIHIRKLMNNDHHSSKLQADWNEYGSSYFNFSIIELVNPVELLLAEQKHLTWLFTTYPYKNHYNIRGAINPDLDLIVIKRRPLSEKRKREISITNSKTYTLVSPNGIITTITNMKEFCKVNNLSSSGMFKVANGKRKSAHGWTLPIVVKNM